MKDEIMERLEELMEQIEASEAEMSQAFEVFERTKADLDRHKTEFKGLLEKLMEIERERTKS